MKKFTSILLSVLILLSCFSIIVGAEDVCKIHSDSDFDGTCEKCGDNVIQNKTGVNTYYYLMGDEVLMLAIFEDPQLDFGLHLTLLYRYDLDAMRDIYVIEHDDSEFDIEELDYYEIEFFTKGGICTPGTYELFRVSFKITKDDFSVEDLPVLVTCGAPRHEIAANDPVIIEAYHDHVDETFDSTCDICDCRYYSTDNHVHTDKGYDFVCDMCGASVFADKPGINTSVLKTHYVIMYQVYTTDVVNFNEIEYKLTYDDSVLTYHGVQYNDAIDIDVENADGIVTVKLNNDGSYQMNPETDFLFIVVFEEKNGFTYDAFPKKDSVTADGIVMSGGIEYIVSAPVVMDGKHDDIDYDMDFFCDTCGLVKKHDCSVYAVDGKCEICKEPIYYYGDMNCDAKITAADARIALRIAAKIQTPTEYELFVGDIDGNGKITAAEARKILRVAAMIDTF